VNPRSNLLADRFRPLELIRERENIRLYLARDVAREEELWLLRLNGPAFRELEGLLRYRLRRFAALPLFRSHEVLSCVRTPDELFLTLTARDCEPLAVRDGGIESRREIESGLLALARSGFWAGQLELEDMRFDTDGPFFLPTAYAMPPSLGRPSRTPFSRDRSACRDELQRFAARAGFDLSFADTAAVSDGPIDWTEWTRRSLGHPSGAELCAGNCASLDMLERVSQACADLGRDLLVMGRYWRSGSLVRPRDAPAPVLVCLGFDDYGAFAESIAQLRRGGWLEGDESFIVAAEALPATGAAGLAISGLSNRIGQEWISSELPEPAIAAPAEAASRLGLRVLQMLQVAGRALPLVTVRDALHCGFEELIPAVVELEDQFGIRGFCAISDESLATPTLLVEDARKDPEPLDAERHAELRHLLRAASPPSKGRVGLGRAWLSLVEALESRDEAALAAGRRLAERARKRKLELLEFAVHERLLGAEGWLKLNAADRCRAAVVLGKQLRVHGRVAEAENIFVRALEEFRGESGLKAASLVAEVVLQQTDLLEHQARFSDIDELLESVSQRYGDGLEPELRGRLYLHHARALRHLARFPESFRKGELALKLFHAETHPRELSEIYTNLGLTHWASSDYASARDAYQRGLALAEEAGDDLSVSRLWNNLGLAHRAAGEFVHAEEALTRSAQIKSRIGDLKGVAATQLNLGFVHLDKGDPGRAKECAIQCLQLARKLSQGELEAQATGLMGECACAAAEYAEAHSLYLENLALCEAQSMRNEHLATLRRLVDLLLRMGDLDAAAIRLQEARDAIPRAGSRFEPALLDVLEARLLRETGAAEAALDLFGSGATKLGSLRRTDLQLEALVEKAQMQISLSRVSAARRTLLAIRELLEQHPQIRVPATLAEVESSLADEGDAGPSTLEDSAELLAVMAEFTRRAQAGEEEAIDAATQLLCQAVAADSVAWLDADSKRSWLRDAGGVAKRHPPQLFGQELESAPAESTEVEAKDHMAFRIGSTNQWIVVEKATVPGKLERLLIQSVVAVLSMALNMRRASAEAEGQSKSPRLVPDHGIIGESAEIRDVLRQIELVKDNDVTVLLLGENGTGKDLVARAIYSFGRRSNGPFHAVNCAAIPHSLLESELFGHERGAFTGAHERHRGLFERADGGTLFLDEIGEMDAAMQSKMLRVLQDRCFTRVGGNETIQSDVRVLAATNRDLRSDIAAGRFRMDLYYRLNVISIQIPALRERAEDIGLLAHHFIERVAPEFDSPVRGIRQEAVARLMAYSWPGNVRELENVIKNAMVFAEGSRIRVEDLPEYVLGGERRSQRRSLEELIQTLLESAELDADRPLMPRLELLLAHQAVRLTQNKTEAARLLGITKPTLYNRLRRFEALYGAEPGIGAASPRVRGRLAGR
jgi:DNA-binding NtrC family response regulator/tetratricopeptide (TPR) repeat protein